jgi:hypothetical protein
VRRQTHFQQGIQTRGGRCIPEVVAISTPVCLDQVLYSYGNGNDADDRYEPATERLPHQHCCPVIGIAVALTASTSQCKRRNR